MSYLYGDSSVSQLQSNFLAFLGDALDFCVQVLLADEQIALCRTAQTDVERDSAAELRCLTAQNAAVKQGLAAGAGTDGSRTERCAAALADAADEVLRSEWASVQETLDRCDALIHAREQTARARCFDSLAALLLRHDPPGASWSLHLETDDRSGYSALLRGATSFGLCWTLELDLSRDGAPARALRVDKLVPELKLHAPMKGGWLHKGSRVRTLRLDGYYVVEAAVSSDEMRLRLSSEPNGSGASIHIHAGPDPAQVRAVRVDSDVGPVPFMLDGSDAAEVRALHGAFIALAKAVALKRRSLVAATLDEVSFLDHPSPKLLVERLIGIMAPITRDIGRHSFAPGELVLKQVHERAENLREEFYVSRESLLQRLEPLSPLQRSLFEPLGLEEPASVSRHSELRRTMDWVSEGLAVANE